MTDGGHRMMPMTRGKRKRASNVSRPPPLHSSIVHNSADSNGAVTTGPRHESPGDEDPEADDLDETHEPARKRQTPCRLGLNSLAVQKKTTRAQTTNGRKYEHEEPWPEEYAPSNPNSPTINCRYRMVIKRWKAMDRDLADLWDKKKGITIPAIRMVKSTSNRLTQRTFGYTDQLLSAMENEDRESQPRTTTAKKDNRAHAEHQQETESVKNEPEKSTEKAAKSHIDPPTRLPHPQTPSDAEECYSDKDPAWADDAFSSPKPELGSPLSDKTIIEVDSNFSVEDTLPSAVRETVRRLRSNEMLQSDDIARCVQFLDQPKDWHVFDPGFPIVGKGHACHKPKPPHLVFFCHAKTHWSLCYVDTAKAVLHHYNSSKDIVMPIELVKEWVERQGVIKLDRAIEIKNEECPQQKGNVDCGIFALAVLKELFAGTAIPKIVDASSDRHDFARKVETAASNAADNGVDATSTANPATSDGQTTDPTTNVSVSVPVESDLVTPVRPLDSTEHLLAQAQAFMGLSIGSQTADKPFIDPQPAFGQPPVIDPTGGSVSTLTPAALQPSSPVEPAQAAIAYLKSFMAERKVLQANKKDWKERLVAQRRSLTTMGQNLSAHRERLEQEEQRVKELEPQVMRLESAANFNKSIRQSIGGHYDSQTGDPILQKWREKLTSTLDEMNAESAALTAQEQDAQAACESHQEEIQRLEDAIIQGRTRQKELEATIKTHNDTLAEMKRLCTKVANEDESADEEEGVEE